MDEAEHSLNVEALKSELSELQRSKATLDSKVKLLESVVHWFIDCIYFCTISGLTGTLIICQKSADCNNLSKISCPTLPPSKLVRLTCIVLH